MDRLTADPLRVERRKVTDYLLNLEHPDAADKARFFLGLGFASSDWKTFADAIIGGAMATDTVKTVKSPYGIKYIVDGYLDAPSGGRRRLRSVWIKEDHDKSARLVTAYPISE